MRLVITLRYLASGKSQRCQSFDFVVGESTLCDIIHQTCDAIWVALNEKYLKCPTSTEDWKSIAVEFFEQWNFPHCVGALDGKHIAINCPPNAGSTYYNYKGFHSVVLLAACDANYCFTLVDIGSSGKDNDAAIFAESKFGKAFTDGKINLPIAEFIGGKELPYVLVGDAIFPLKTWLVKPYSGRNLSEKEAIFNYRLSRCRRTIENTFGIYVAKWQIFRSPIRAAPSTVDKNCKGNSMFAQLPTDNCQCPLYTCWLHRF